MMQVTKSDEENCTFDFIDQPFCPSFNACRDWLINHEKNINKNKRIRTSSIKNINFNQTWDNLKQQPKYQLKKMILRKDKNKKESPNWNQKSHTTNRFSKFHWYTTQNFIFIVKNIKRIKIRYKSVKKLTKNNNRWNSQARMNRNPNSCGKGGRAHVDVIADGGDLLVGLLVDPVGANLVQDLVHCSSLRAEKSNSQPKKFQRRWRAKRTIFPFLCIFVIVLHLNPLH